MLIPLLALALASTADEPKKLLLVTHSGGFIHDSVGVAEDVLTTIGPKHGYTVTTYRFTGDPDKKVKYKESKDAPEKDVTALEKYSTEFRQRTGKMVGPENIGRINAETLKKFDAVLFFTTGNPLTKSETADLLAWVKAGGAFCGTHCATDTLYGEPSYGDMIGGYFRGHPPGVQKVVLKNEDPKHPAATFTNGTEYTDEIYVFHDKPYSRDKIRIIYSATGFNPGANLKRADQDYAISWCKAEGSGKVFYTSFGHKKDVWNDPAFQVHLIGGIDWATGRKPGDATPQGKK
jgi:uncharacterized protein